MHRENHMRKVRLRNMQVFSVFIQWGMGLRLAGSGGKIYCHPGAGRHGNIGRVMTKIAGASLVVASLIAGMLCVEPAIAQTGTPERSSGTATVNRDHEARKSSNKAAAKPSAKTSAISTPQTGSSANDAARGGNAWSISDALPKDSKVVTEKASPPPAKKDFGRLQLDTGSVGLQMESQFKDGQFADGRRVPGLETVKREQPGFVGLSLSVPTSSISLFPSSSNPVRE